MTTTSANIESDIFKVNENDYQWIANTNDPETVTLVKFLGTVTPQTLQDSLLPQASINIPYILGGKIVTIIGPNAYANNTIIDRVVIHPDIISIEARAFKDCTNLKYIAFYNDAKIKYIKQDAFLNTAIKAPVIPGTVLSIETGAFNTQALKSVTFNGNAPSFTEDSFNSQGSNGNYKDLITINYYTNAIGFTNPNENKFLFISNNKMMVVPEQKATPPAKKSTSIFTYIIYFVLFILLIGGGFFIYSRYFKKEKYETIESNAGDSFKEGDIGEPEHV
jgi:hypothetical protein